jgi:cell division protein FtsB
MSRKESPLVKIKSSRGISGRAFAFVTVLALMAITLAPPVQRYFAQRAQINALRIQLNDSKSSLENARRDLALWNDPTYIAAQARSRLQFVFPGEIQYEVTGIEQTSDSKGAPAAPIADQIPLGLPWYGRLISSITSTNTQINP